MHAPLAGQVALVKSFSLSPCVNVVRSGSTFRSSRKSSPNPCPEPSVTLAGAHDPTVHLRAALAESAPVLPASTQSSLVLLTRLPSISKLFSVVLSAEPLSANTSAATMARGKTSRNRRRRRLPVGPITRVMESLFLCRRCCYSAAKGGRNSFICPPYLTPTGSRSALPYSRPMLLSRESPPRFCSRASVRRGTRTAL